MNRLELKGRDRDKLIYLKRGHTGDTGCRGILLKHGHLHYSCPYWSTDRNDAWELWDELPYPKVYCHGVKEGIVDDKKHSVGIILPWQSYWTYTDGTSFADAVSRAWLQWYYNTQWMKE